MSRFVRRVFAAWMRLEDSVWGDAIGAVALFALLFMALFIILGFGGWGPLG